MSTTDGDHSGHGAPADAAALSPAAGPSPAVGAMASASADGRAEAPAPELAPLALLLAVQALDLAADQLAYRRRELPERAELAGIERTTADLRARHAALQSERGELGAGQERLDHQVELLTSRMRTIEARLNSGGAASFRDQEAMANEAASLDRQRRALEDQELEIMEALEPVDAELSTVRTELEAADDGRAAAGSALASSEAALDQERAAVAAERQALAAALPADLAATYERLRAKLGGVGAARLADGTCGGCHLRLPARERDLVQHAPDGTVFYCEQCGRILVP